VKEPKYRIKVPFEATEAPDPRSLLSSLRVQTYVRLERDGWQWATIHRMRVKAAASKPEASPSLATSAEATYYLWQCPRSVLVRGHLIFIQLMLRIQIYFYFVFNVPLSVCASR
jgi:hypothetical protein